MRLLKFAFRLLLGRPLRGGWRMAWLMMVGGVGALAGLVALCNLWVVLSTHSLIVTDVQSASPDDVALVLGTSKHVAPGRANRHFANRMKTAAALFKAGRVKHLLVSGDNSSKYYNEPNDMHHALEESGVPAESITRDFAGFRTLDSIVRAHEIFQLDHFTIVSDGFHLPRAVFIAKRYGLEVRGVASERVPLRWSFKTEAREWLARVKAVLDIYLLDTPPRFLGEPIPIMVHSTS